MSKFKLVCPFMGNVHEDVFCIGSDCAMWAQNTRYDAKEDTGCCGLACSGVAHGMCPEVFRDPAVGGDEE